MSKQLSPNISVIIPVYKPPINYFKACLDSLHNQTMSNVEFIIVFDGNDEALYSFCKNYQKNDPRFKLYVQPHLGVSATRNFGIKQSSGEYITFVDADDWIENQCCQSTYDFAKENDSDIVLFDYIPVDGQNELRTYSNTSILKLSSNEIKILQQQTIALTDPMYIAAVSTWGKLIKRSIIIDNSITFSTSIKIAVDRPFMYEIYTFGNRISYLHSPFYNYNKVENSISYKKYFSKNILLLDYLAEIKRFSKNDDALIGNQAFIYFGEAQNDLYFNKQNKLDYFHNIIYLCKIAKSTKFQDLISTAETIKLSLINKIELFLLKRKYMSLIWIRTFKRMIF